MKNIMKEGPIISVGALALTIGLLGLDQMSGQKSVLNTVGYQENGANVKEKTVQVRNDFVLFFEKYTGDKLLHF